MLSLHQLQIYYGCSVPPFNSEGADLSKMPLIGPSRPAGHSSKAIMVLWLKKTLLSESQTHTIHLKPMEH